MTVRLFFQSLIVCVVCHSHILSGSHVPWHQALGVQNLFSLLRPGGIYIVEDLETNYWTKGDIYGYDVHSGIGAADSCSLVNRLRSAVHVLNREYAQDLHSGTFEDGVDHDFGSISFGQNIVMIEKKTSYWRAFENRKYDRVHPGRQGGPRPEKLIRSSAEYDEVC